MKQEEELRDEEEKQYEARRAAARNAKLRQQQGEMGKVTSSSTGGYLTHVNKLDSEKDL